MRSGLPGGPTFEEAAPSLFEVLQMALALAQLLLNLCLIVLAGFAAEPGPVDESRGLQFCFHSFNLDECLSVCSHRDCCGLFQESARFFILQLSIGIVVLLLYYHFDTHDSEKVLSAQARQSSKVRFWISFVPGLSIPICDSAN
jgi:hypothetical protein